MTSFQLEKAIDIITAIEQTFDVNSLIYKNLKIWPLIRFALWSQILNPDMNFTRKKVQGDHRFYVLCLSEEQSSLFEKKDVLFFSRMEEHLTERIDGKAYNYIMDPWIELVKKRYTFEKLEIEYTEQKEQLIKTLPRFEPTLLIHPIAVKYQLDSIVSIDGFPDLQQVVLHYSKLWIDEELFLDQARSIKMWENIFIQILMKIQPRMVMLVCYYYSFAMSLISACKKIKIISVDIQHAPTGCFDAPYSHWTKIPCDGYDLLPDFFWSWGESSKEKVEKWYPPNSRPPLPVVGGNLRIQKWLYRDDLIINDDINLYYNTLKQIKKVFLVALQCFDLPEHLLLTMKEFSRDCLWLIRLHPIHRSIEYKNKIKSLFCKYNIQNYEMEYASICPLYGLLKRCNYVLTASSSTCYESLAFNVPTILFDPAGLQFHKDEIKKGVFIYADTSEKIVMAIKQGIPNLDKIDISKYINTNRTYAEKALHIIINHSLANNLKKYLQNQDIAINYALSMNKLGTEFSKKGYIKAAINSFTSSVKSNPNLAISYNNLGVLYSHTDKIHKALQHFVRALELAPNDQRIIDNVIAFLKIIGKMTEQGNMLLLF